MKQSSISIILLNWNGCNETIQCIKMLQKIDYKNYKIILVDNGSRDDSVKILKEKFPNIDMITIEHNKGFSGGANVGMQYALKNKPEYILLLNNDAKVKHNFLSELVKVAESNKKIGIVGSMVYYQNNKRLIQSAGGYKNFKGLYPFKGPYQDKIDNGQFKKNILVDTMSGCSMLIKREVIEKIGMLDENHFIYAEDIDFCVRAKKAGYLLYTAVKSKVWHKVSASSGGREKNLTFLYYNTRNLIYFSKKHLKFNEKIIYNFYYLFGRLCTVGKFFLQGEYKPVQAILIGIIHGYIGRMGSYQLK